MDSETLKHFEKLTDAIVSIQEVQINQNQVILQIIDYLKIMKKQIESTHIPGKN